jgi:hypothetical protein
LPLCFKESRLALNLSTRRLPRPRHLQFCDSCSVRTPHLFHACYMHCFSRTSVFEERERCRKYSRSVGGNKSWDKLQTLLRSGEKRNFVKVPQVSPTLTYEKSKMKIKTLEWVFEVRINDIFINSSSCLPGNNTSPLRRPVNLSMFIEYET